MKCCMRTLYSGISAGTELATYRGTNPYLRETVGPRPLALFLPGQSTFSYPVDVWGYSEVGEIDAVGPGTSGVAVGDVVWGIWGHRSSCRAAGRAADRPSDRPRAWTRSSAPSIASARWR